MVVEVSGFDLFIRLYIEDTASLVVDVEELYIGGWGSDGDMI
jgi:hypothetical protein